ncbi:MAG: YncE family protein, partial [Gammaproteobacteria bacterium]
MKRLTHSQSVRLDVPFFATLVCLTTLGLAAIPASVSADSNDSTRSTNIALNRSGSLLFNVNHEANSVTVFSIRGDRLSKLDEVPVGREPFCVAVEGGSAFVTNSASGTVSVVERSGGNFKVVKEIKVGTEPRGCVLTPDGRRLFVANHTAGTVSVINTRSNEVVDTIELGGNPMAIAVHKNRVFVTDFFARLIPDPDGSGPLQGGQEGFDDGKQGIVHSFPVNDPDNITQITLSPLADSAFTANRKDFCNVSRDPDPINQEFCPDRDTADPNDPDILQDPQAVQPNQLHAALICDGKLYLPHIGAQPEPPVFFNVNVQALVHVV